MENTSSRLDSPPHTERHRLARGSKLQILEQVNLYLSELMTEDHLYEVELLIYQLVQRVQLVSTVWEEYATSVVEERF
jgi:hypothetical protein